MNRLWSKFLLSYVALLFLAVGASSVLSNRHLRSHMLASLEQDLARSARMVATLMTAGNAQERLEGATWDDFCRRVRDETGYRLTIVSTEGTVLGDSEEPSVSLENHLYRPEIQEALEKGWAPVSGTVTRCANL
jgi:two-component system phosphate regulon sensor histidine kinase PhoR